MKQILKLSLLLLALLLPATATAHDFEVDGIYYRIINDNEAEVTFQGNNYLNAQSYSGDVTIPESVTHNSSTYHVTSIGVCAFYCCDGLTNVVIPNSVVLIDENAFESCSCLTSISIPNSVTEIKSQAFLDCSGLTNVNISNSVTSIYQGTFNGCTSLTSVNLPNSISIISYDAFRNCSSLTSIEIPNSVKDIDPEAFMGCSSLTEVHIPSSVERIGWAAFAFCPSLNSITVANDNPYFDSRDNCNAIIQKAYTLYNPTSDVILVAGCKNTVIPDSVTVFDFASFAGCTSLDSITIPSSVTTICDYAFQDCSSLSEINIPSSVTAIADGAFSGCTTLNNVYCHISDPTAINMGSEVFVRNPQNYAERTLYVPIGSLGVYQANRKWSQYFGNIVEIDVSPHIEFVDANVKVICVQNWDTNGDGELSHLEAAAVTSLNNAFSNNNTITSFDELEYFTGLSSINEGEFAGCSELTSVNIPCSVTSIDYGAFEECNKLTNMSIPNSVTYIGFRALEETAWYSNQPDGLVYVGLVAYKYKGTMPESTSINIKEGTFGISYGAFLSCTGLISVTIPNSVNYIDTMAFELCSNLTNVSFGNSITTIGDFAFYSSGLTSVAIPNSVTSICNYVFDNCPDITSITVAEDNPKYDSRNNCNAIIETSSNTLITGCKNTIIPNSVTAIGWSAFNGCSNLTNIVIPNSVTWILDNAFDGCANLTTVICKSLTPPWLGSMNFMSSSPTLYVPKSSLEVYLTDNAWCQFQTILPIEGNIVNDYLSMEGTTALYGDTIVIPVALTNANDTRWRD